MRRKRLNSVFETRSNPSAKLLGDTYRCSMDLIPEGEVLVVLELQVDGGGQINGTLPGHDLLNVLESGYERSVPHKLGQAPSP
ncbi:MAG TPA: hypothetical protein PLH93_06015 [Flavobacteriales bacterium]|nr:hypothetical protein [Flavobacteriales bacterium]